MSTKLFAFLFYEKVNENFQYIKALTFFLVNTGYVNVQLKKSRDKLKNAK